MTSNSLPSTPLTNSLLMNLLRSNDQIHPEERFPWSEERVSDDTYRPVGCWYSHDGVLIVIEAMIVMCMGI